MSSPRFVTGGPAVASSGTSYDSRSEDDGLTTTRDTTYSNNNHTRDRNTSHSRDANWDTSYSQRDVTFASRNNDVTFASRNDDVTLRSSKPDTTMTTDTSADTERHGSYNFYQPPHEKTECGCSETGGWQKLSFLLLIITFMGNAIALCTPYWVVAYEGDQMSLYEGVWLSCYRERGVGRWICSTYDVIRNLFEQPTWYEAAQVTAVLAVILLIPALIVGGLYSYVVSLRGRTRASYVFLAFAGTSGLCSFLSFVVFAAGYPLDQTFPPGGARLHISFGMQIISFLCCAVTIATHLKDSYPELKVWDNNQPDAGKKPRLQHGFPIGVVSKAPRLPPLDTTSDSHKSHHSSRLASAPPHHPPPPPALPLSSSQDPKVAVTKSSSKLSFSLPKFQSAFSRFRSSKGNDSMPSSPPPPPPPAKDFDAPRERSASGRGLETLSVPAAPTTSAVPSSSPSQRAPGNTSYRSYATSHNDSMSGYDSQV